LHHGQIASGPISDARQTTDGNRSANSAGRADRRSARHTCALGTSRAEPPAFAHSFFPHPSAPQHCNAQPHNAATPVPPPSSGPSATHMPRCHNRGHANQAHARAAGSSSALQYRSLAKHCLRCCSPVVRGAASHRHRSDTLRSPCPHKLTHLHASVLNRYPTSDSLTLITKPSVPTRVGTDNRQITDAKHPTKSTPYPLNRKCSTSPSFTS
jgi:hypothetical protein